ncbi:ACC synthase [Thecamonas trahens ATCC 50062]|uniref:ACC synthase n=1 Tax=Thecamonas trahens ATCC 50062 TaxID=461836 RepID=A0A0L0DPZ2_THETB|nr:ACC synthase [Thecamonas trahens ATCC 50062]KNC54372.1 ACC synthase [Thecamonas trahens ATCC 50062]|eukprot:XP_013753674.1 ACC synthase [Thecamonas trahens ATCC 50062]
MVKGKLSARGQELVDSPALMGYVREHLARVGTEGYVPACIAESDLCSEEMAARLAAVPPMPPHNLHYGSMVGEDALRTAVLGLLVHAGVLPADAFTAHQVALVAGVGTALEMLMYAIADPGEGVLVPAPTYAGFYMDLGTRDELAIVLAQRSADNEWALTPEALDAAWDAADVPIRALLLCNPDNPLGRVYSHDELTTAVAWARAKGIHIVVDEIYALSVFADNASFVSAAATLGPDTLGDDVHLLWGFSKDFGVGGLRCGGVLSHNSNLLAAIDGLGYWGAVSRHTQWALHHLLVDMPWIDSYLATSKSRLRDAYQVVTDALDACGIPYVPAVAGMFFVVDLRQFLDEPTWEGEARLWQRLLDNHGLNLTPGSELRAAEPGWFRLCFAAFDASVIAETMAAIE